MSDFDEIWNDGGALSSCSRDEAEDFYNEGAQSQQAKIDELQKKIDCYRKENKAHLEKIDGALKILKDWDDQSYRDDMDQLTGEIEDILKGNKDEN